MTYLSFLGEIFDAISRWDTACFYIINLGTQNGFFDLIMPVLSDVKLWRWPLVGAAVLTAIGGGRKARVTVLLALVVLVLGDQLSSRLLKPLISRLRPSHALEGVRLLMGRGSRYGFPSSHATNIFAIWTILAVRYRKAGPYLLVIPVAVAYSRIYVGRHYPLDVIGGMILGILCALFVLKVSQSNIFDPLTRRWKTRARVEKKDRKDR